MGGVKRSRKVKYPCGACRLDCLDGTVFCEGCKFWFHSGCVSLSRADMVVLGKNQFPFFCRSCTEDGCGQFDYGAGLCRLQTSFGTQSDLQAYRDLEKAVEVERMIFGDRAFSFPAAVPVYDGLAEDESAKRILETCYGSIQKRALAVPGDGNCLFHAVSVALVGNVSLAVELRYRCVLEMVTHKDYYVDLPHAQVLTDYSPMFMEAAVDCARLVGFSSPWTIQVLSSVAGMPFSV